MAYPFQTFYINAVNKTAIVLQWQLDPTFRGISPLNFTMELSETPDFSQLVISKSVGNSFYVIDDSKKRQSHVVSTVYRIKLVTGDGKTYYSETLNYFAQAEWWHQYLIAAEITRKELLRMKYTGNYGWLLKRKNYGELALDDLDPVSGMPLTDNKSNYANQIAGGYHSPLKITYSLEGNQSQTNLNPEGLGVTDIEQVSMRMVGFPIVSAKDVIATHFGHRYLVNGNVEYVQYLGSNIIIVQQFNAALLQPSDPIHKIKITDV
jgi:hypothetical protein